MTPGPDHAYDIERYCTSVSIPRRHAILRGIMSGRPSWLEAILHWLTTPWRCVR